MTTTPAAVVLDGCPQPFPQELVERSAQYQNTRSAIFCGFLGSESPSAPAILIATRFAETNNIHKVAFPLGMRKQLTFSQEPISMAHIRPNNHGFVFMRDSGGNEQHQIYYFDLASGRQHLLTDGVSKHGTPVWNEDGSRLAFYSSMKNGRDFDIYVLPVTAEGKPAAPPTCVVEGFQNLGVQDFHKNSLLVRRGVSINEAYLTLVTLNDDLTLKASTSVVPEGGAEGDKIAITCAAFVDVGGATHILLSSDAGEEYNTLRRHDAAGQHAEKITNGKTLPWNVESVVANGSRFAFVINENGQSRVFVGDAAQPGAALLEVALPEPGVVDDVTFSADGAYLGFDFDCATSPADVYV